MSQPTIDAVCEQIRDTQQTAQRVHDLLAENARLRHTLRRIANTAGAKRANRIARQALEHHNEEKNDG